MTLCSVCKKNPAVVFVNKIVDGKPNMEGLCLTCAKDKGINPLASMMQQYGASQEDIDNLSEQFNEIMESVSSMDIPEDMLEGMDETGEKGNPFSSMMSSFFPGFGNKENKESEKTLYRLYKNKALLTNSGIARYLEEAIKDNNCKKTQSVDLSEYIPSEIISYLDFFINQRKSDKFTMAVAKWTIDRDYIRNYKIGEYSKIGVIYRNN